VGLGVDLEDVAFSPPLGLYAVVGEAGTIITSPDGATWTTRTSGTTARLRGVAWIPFFGGFFVVVGGLCTVLTSADGVTWTDCSIALGTAELQSVTSDGVGLIVAVGTTGALVTSTDGTAYNLGTDITTVDLQAVRYDPTLPATWSATGRGLGLHRRHHLGAVTTPNTDPNMGLRPTPPTGSSQDAADTVGPPPSTAPRGPRALRSPVTCSPSPGPGPIDRLCGRGARHHRDVRPRHLLDPQTSPPATTSQHHLRGLTAGRRPPPGRWCATVRTAP
jgi:hypothetical protein